MDEKPELFASTRLEVLVNGKQRAILGAQPGESISIGVMQFADKSELVMTAHGGTEAKLWRRGTVLNGIGDEVLVRVVGPGTYEVPPAKWFPMPPQPSKQEDGAA
jgi:hypothetical protein